MQILAIMSAEELKIQSGIESLGKLFAIVLALAIGEAFRQFVSGSEEKRNIKTRFLHLCALVGFIVLVVPFFHGMARHFFEAYITPPRSELYGLSVLFDTLIFTMEAVIFFILARSLDPKDYLKFYKAVGCLLAIDIVWGLVSTLQGNESIWKWVIINIVALPLLIMTLWLGQKRFSNSKIIILCLCILFARTSCDYWWNWDFYFPTE